MNPINYLTEQPYEKRHVLQKRSAAFAPRSRNRLHATHRRGPLHQGRHDCLLVPGHRCRSGTDNHLLQSGPVECGTFGKLDTDNGTDGGGYRTDGGRQPGEHRTGGRNHRDGGRDDEDHPRHADGRHVRTGTIRRFPGLHHGSRHLPQRALYGGLYRRSG